MMIAERFQLDWYSYFRCSNADAEAIDLMVESGCKGVFLGIESGSPAILANMAKHADTSQYEWAMERLHAAGVLTFASFIVGFPGETAQTVEETRAFIARTRPHYYRAQLWYNEPGTPIRNQREKWGIEGDGFVWRHRTMESLEAMDHIDRLFLSVSESLWLPQWSFDFWIIPYLFGRGLRRDDFGACMRHAHELLRLEIAGMDGPGKAVLQQRHLDALRALLGREHAAGAARPAHP
jgi:p-methyltransferase